MGEKIMRTRSRLLGIAALLAAASLSHAGPVGPLTTFTAGTPAKASEVNGNFSAVSTAVNANDGRISTLEGVNAASRITTLETTVSGGNVTPAGNIVLVPSTTTTGSILKGTFPFIHNFGVSNTFIGVSAGNFAMTGNANTASGNSALQSNTTGFSNTASGAGALSKNSTGTNNTASGAGALNNNTAGSFNTASGDSALSSNTTGNSNTASGVNALFLNTTGASNTASGASALQNNTTGNFNTASGMDALLHNTTGASNTASGAFALQANTTGQNNTASGVGALQANTTGNFNTASGVGALQNNTTGSDNIAIGSFAGLNLTTGSSNIHIGNTGVAADANFIRIGSAQAATFIAGIRSTPTFNADAIAVMVDSAGQLGTMSSSRRVKDEIADMGTASSALMKLRPVTFHYKSDKKPKGRTLQYGLVAEEVAEVAPGLVAHSADGKIETVYYQFLAPMLLNEYQKQQRTIAAQTARIVQLEKQSAEIAELKQQITRMTGLLGRLEEARVASAGR